MAINFGGVSRSLYNSDSSQIAVLPVPYDATSTWIKGADKGPEAMLDASANMELYDIETDSEVYLKGIYTEKPVLEKSSPELMADQVRSRTMSLLEQDKFVVTLGGEHSISIGAIYAHAEKFKNLTILQLDAHADLRDEYEGSKCNHACVMARAMEVAPVVQVGIRSMDVSEKGKVSRDRIFFSDDILRSDGNWQGRVVDKLTENVYITIDLDVFDPSIMPATGTPEPGGLTWLGVLALMRMIILERKVVGFDVVELCPREGSHASNFLAAKLIYKILSYRFGK